MQLKNKIAIVTGGARGIGAGIARCLADEGAIVALIDLDGEAAMRTAAELERGAIGLAADVSQETQVAAATAQVAERFGGVDIFVNNAGGGRPGSGMGNPFTRISQQDWDEQFQTNLRTAFAGCKAAIPLLQQRGGGSIINIASIAGLMPIPTTPAYGAAKAGMVSLTQTLALELAPRQIRVNAICPGLLWTRAWEMLAGMIKAATPQLAALSPRDIFLERVRRNVPMGREQTPEDVGRLTAFLCSDAAQNITGQAITIDGGITLKVGG
ncbi:MAG TPA: SDR family oxidoreductase [Solimonas sp.]|nr:SDR family oxidoreductase [Solimonas sp.]